MISLINAWSYDQVCRELTHTFQRQCGNGSIACTRMVGLLFARPDVPLAREQIVPSLNYYHHRSGRDIDFFCAGYSRFSHESNEKEPVEVGDWWEFNPITYCKFQEEIQRRSRWLYSGEVDLILLDGKRDDFGNAYLDFEYAWVCDLNNMIRNNAIESVHRFFEHIFRFVEMNPNNQARDFTRVERKSMIVKGLKESLLACLPANIGQNVINYVTFVGCNLDRHRT